LAWDALIDVVAATLEKRGITRPTAPQGERHEGNSYPRKRKEEVRTKEKEAFTPRIRFTSKIDLKIKRRKVGVEDLLDSRATESFKR